MKQGKLILGLGLGLGLALLLVIERVSATALWLRAQTFVTIFLGIFVEALPFLLAGALISGMLSQYVAPSWIQRLVPRQPWLAAIGGTLLGLFFPVCECGVVPVTRRLYQKGVPLSVGVAFLLAAPVINPIVIASTYAAYGWGPMLWYRIGAGFVIAAAVGGLFHFAEPATVLRKHSEHHSHHLAGFETHTAADVKEPADGTTPRFWLALSTGGDEFLEMIYYLIVGCLLAAGLQVLVPQATLMTLGTGPFTSVLAMQALAFVLSICSTVDAFVSLAFVNAFAPGAILAFLIFGPMVDLKSLWLFRQVFEKRAVAYLVILPFLMTLLTALLINSWGA